MPITNRVTEKDLRDYLTDVGYFGRSAKIHELELVAIQRPGWVQVFRVHLDAKHQDTGWAEFWAAIRDDERERFEVVLFDTEETRDVQIDEWSEGLVTVHHRGQSPVAAALAGLVMLVLLAIGAVKLFASS